MRANVTSYQWRDRIAKVVQNFTCSMSLLCNLIILADIFNFKCTLFIIPAFMGWRCCHAFTVENRDRIKMPHLFAELT